MSHQQAFKWKSLYIVDQVHPPRKDILVHIDTIIHKLVPLSQSPADAPSAFTSAFGEGTFPTLFMSSLALS